MNDTVHTKALEQLRKQLVQSQSSVSAALVKVDELLAADKKPAAGASTKKSKKQIFEESYNQFL